MEPREYSLLPAFYFSVYIGGESTSFQDVSGISSEMTCEEVLSGGEIETRYMLPKSIKRSNLVLKRGLLKDGSAFSAWCKSIFNNGIESMISTKKILVHLMDKTHNPVHSWEFKDAYPVKWEIESFNSLKNEVAVEKIEFAYASSRKL